MESNGYISKVQKDMIYTEYLAPLKAKIASILLYDTEKAGEFLQKYNDILKTGEQLGLNIIDKITELKYEIEDYEQSTQGKEELYRDQSRIVIQQLEDLQQKQEELETKDFEYEFLNIKEIYEQNSSNYSYTDRSNIEAYMASTQAKLIIRKVRDGAIDLHDEIEEKDANGLVETINNGIFTLMQNEDPKIQNIVSEIKYKMIGRTDAIYDPEIWRLLDSAQRSGEDIEVRRGVPQKASSKSSSTLLPALPAVPENRKRFSFPKLFQKKIKMSAGEIILSDTVQIGNEIVRAKELSKITIDSLASQVSQELLEEIEEKRLKKEKRTEKEKFVSDSRLPIYDFFEDKSVINEFDFYNEEGNKINFRILEANVSYWIEIEGIDGTTQKSYVHEYEFKGINSCIIKYAGLIDKITGANIQEQVKNELGILYEKYILSDGKKSNGELLGIYNLLKKLPICSNLAISYANILKEVEKSKINFRSKDKIERDKFYGKNNFKDELKIEEDNSETQESKKRDKKHKKEKNKEKLDKKDGR